MKIVRRCRIRRWGTCRCSFWLCLLGFLAVWRCEGWQGGEVGHEYIHPVTFLLSCPLTLFMSSAVVSLANQGLKLLDSELLGLFSPSSNRSAAHFSLGLSSWMTSTCWTALSVFFRLGGSYSGSRRYPKRPNIHGFSSGPSLPAFRFIPAWLTPSPPSCLSWSASNSSSKIVAASSTHTH